MFFYQENRKEVEDHVMVSRMWFYPFFQTFRTLAIVEVLLYRFVNCFSVFPAELQCELHFSIRIARLQLQSALACVRALSSMPCL